MNLKMKKLAVLVSVFGVSLLLGFVIIFEGNFGKVTVVERDNEKQ